MGAFISLSALSIKNRFKTCFRDFARTGNETGLVEWIVLEKKERRKIGRTKIGGKKKLNERAKGIIPILNETDVKSLYTKIAIKKLFYVNEEDDEVDDCILLFYKIYLLFDVFNIAQFRVVILRYMSWSFVEIIFMVFFYGYVKGMFLFSRKKEYNNKSEKKFSNDTRNITFFLQYFIIVIRLFSIAVGYIYYIRTNDLPDNADYYKKCLTDKLMVDVYIKINETFSKIITITIYLLCVSVFSTVIDLTVRIRLIIYSYMRRSNKRLSNLRIAQIKTN